MKFETYLWIAKRLPLRLRYAAVVDAFARASTEKYSNKHIDDITYSNVIEGAFPALRFDRFWCWLTACGFWKGKA
jgi:hypothetical protein